MHEGQRLSFMINDILDSSKLKAGKMQLHQVPINACKAVEKVVMSLRQARDQSSGNALLADDVTLRNDMNAKLPAIMVGAMCLFLSFPRLQLCSHGNTPRCVCFKARLCLNRTTFFRKGTQGARAPLWFLAL